jgi:soluble lytic murein transglycosylase-like protein
MLNTNIYLQNIDKLNYGSPSKDVKTMTSGYSDPFYSVLIKHQMNMIKAWSPVGSGEMGNIDPLALSKTLLKLKGITNSASIFRTPISSHRIAKSYVVAQELKAQDLSKPSIKELAGHIAVKNGVPINLFQKLIQTESNYDPSALSPRGAMGLGQIMPETAKELGLDIGKGETSGSVWHPESNLDASARYLKKLYDKYRKEEISEEEAWNFAAGAYNAGMGNIAKAINKISHGPVTTWDQVAQVLPKVTGKYSQETIRYVNKLRG